MPCFNYGSSSPTYVQSFVGSAGVELTYNASGNTYSFSSISRLCFFPNKDQIKVWKKLSVNSPEVAQIYSDTILADGYYKIVNEDVILGVAPASGQVIIRRATPNTEMFVNFTDGAKLTAEQLNLCFAQLLFIAQEKEFIGNVNNHFYPIANSYTVWSAGTSYTLNSYVSYAQNFTDGFGNTYSVNKIYKCIAPTTPGIVPTNGAYWEPVSYTTNGFIIEGAPLSVPVVFDLSNVAVNHGLIWNGGKFVAGYLGGGTLDSLSDVQITTPADKQLLQYDNATQLWKNVTLPLKFVSPNNVTLFQGKSYYDATAGGALSTGNSFTEDGVTSTISAPVQLNAFKNGNNWVIPNIPTVYHVLKKIHPTEADPATFFTNVQNTIDYVNANAGNPIRLKFFWNLNDGRFSNISHQANTEPLDSVLSLYWDKPQELYNTTMWDNLGGFNTLLYHGVIDVLNPTKTYKVSPYFYSLADTATPANDYWKSKIHGYGITSNGFYLSVPECYTTCLERIPIFSSEGTDETNHVYTQLTNLGAQTVTLQQKFDSLSAWNGAYLDTYLEGLRDLLSAAPYKGDFVNIPASVKRREYAARHHKGNLLDAIYRGFEDISFKRLELSESPKVCLWKIPKNIVYYNKYALSFSRISASRLITSNENAFFDQTEYAKDNPSKGVRFTGSGQPFENIQTGTNTVSTTKTGATHGFLAKGNDVWDAWCTNWSAQGDSNASFNEADIDWLVEDQTANSTTTALGLPSSISNNLFISKGWQETNAGANSPYSVVNWRNADNFLPWPYRPNNISSDGQTGTHLFNVDVNKLFSEAANFIPDPCDEYVFRLIGNGSLVNTFRDTLTSSSLKTAIILEYGFTEQQTSGSNDIKNLAKTIFSKNKFSNFSHSVHKHQDQSKIKVYVQNEHIEQYSGSSRYVLTLCIRVPRFKSIGYSRVFRKMSTSTEFENDTSSDFFFPEPAVAGSSQDTDKDYGPWLARSSIGNDIANQFTGSNNIAQTGTITTGQVTMTDNSDATQPDFVYPNGPYEQAGRNECAVKFSRMGIPSNLWIRLSVLNTDGTTELIDNSGWI